MDADLSEVLMLLHTSAGRWRSLRAAGEEWRDEQRSLDAFSRRRPPGSIISMRGAPGPVERDPAWQLWVRQPDHVRVEFGGAHGGRITQISDGIRTWLRGPDGQSPVQERQGPRWLELGPASVLIDTRVVPAGFDLETIGPMEVLGRACVGVRARPLPVDPRHGPSLVHPLLHGADEVRLAVDTERGVLLRLEALLSDAAYYRMEMTMVGFDEELADELFALPAGEDGGLREPTPVRAPGIARAPRPRRLLHGGPQDDIIGEPTKLHPLLARTDSVVVVVDRVIAYPDGFELHVSVRTRDDQQGGTTEPTHPRTWGGSAAFPGESLRFGVVLSDGRRSFVDNYRQNSPLSDLALIPLSGSGSAGRFDQRFWVRPLPPPGPVGLLVEWERRGVPETRVDVPAEDILEAASRATRIWTTEGPAPSAG